MLNVLTYLFLYFHKIIYIFAELIFSTNNKNPT